MLQCVANSLHWLKVVLFVLLRTPNVMQPSDDKIALKFDEIGRYEIGRTFRTSKTLWCNQINPKKTKMKAWDRFQKYKTASKHAWISNTVQHKQKVRSRKGLALKRLIWKYGPSLAPDPKLGSPLMSPVVLQMRLEHATLFGATEWKWVLLWVDSKPWEKQLLEAWNRRWKNL